MRNKPKLPGGLKSESVRKCDSILASDFAKKACYGSEVKRSRDQAVLNQALLAAGVREVFSISSLKELKMEEELKDRGRCLISGIAAWSGALTMLMILALLFNRFLHNLNADYIVGVAEAAAITVVLLALPKRCKASLRELEEQEDGLWSSTNILEHQGDVPEEAILLAGHLCEVEPNMNVKVEFMFMEHYCKTYSFLVAGFGDAVAYIAVWDEKEYIPSYQPVEK